MNKVLKGKKNLIYRKNHSEQTLLVFYYVFKSTLWNSIHLIILYNEMNITHENAMKEILYFLNTY
ncbi:MAG: hypothetical protein CMO16_03415 [Thaumarchaeota archaeon]|nr:hypothetical protein [Nitrososphaerota archaeon]